MGALDRAGGGAEMHWLREGAAEQVGDTRQKVHPVSFARPSVGLIHLSANRDRGHPSLFAWWVTGLWVAPGLFLERLAN